MILYLTISIIILSLFYYARIKQVGFALIPLLVLVFEIGKNISGILMIDTGYNGYMFLMLFIFIIQYYYIRDNRLGNSKVYKNALFILIIMTIYFIFRLDISFANIFNIITRFGNFILILFLFFVSYKWFDNIHRLFMLNHYFILSVVIYILFTITLSLLKVGETAYTGGIIRGPTQFQLYFAVLPLILSFMINILNKKQINKYNTKSTTLYIIYSICILIVALSLMRTTWLMLAVGVFVFIFSIQKNKTNRRLLAFVLLIIAASIIILINTDILDVRRDRFSDNYDINEEGRIIEIELVNYSLNSNNTLIFGEGNLFNARDKYGFSRYSRPLHGTYANILFGSGYLGLALYILFFIMILYSFIKIKSNNVITNTMKATGLAVLFAVMTAYFSANTTYGYGISYFILSFVYLGALLRLSETYNV